MSLATAAHVAASDKGKDNDRDRANRLSATLVGINEVPSVSTGASGHLTATISQDERRLSTS